MFLMEGTPYGKCKVGESLVCWSNRKEARRAGSRVEKMEDELLWTGGRAIGQITQDGEHLGCWPKQVIP